MTKLAILEYPDPRLRKTAKPIDVVDEAVRQLADDLLETMYAAKGIGLAATQVDVHRRVLVLDVSEQRDDPLVFINPEILSAEGRGPGEEGCLSVPDIYDKVQRATHIRVRALGTMAWRSKWRRRGCLPSAFNMRWTISKASFSSIICLN